MSDHTCINCGRNLVMHHGRMICLQCNSDELNYTDIFKDNHDDDRFVMIECPGATLYEPGTNNVIAGVDLDHPTKPGRIVEHPVYAPNHKKKRRIKKEAEGKIRRCRACQDYTIRMRRKEGADFYIPSVRHPQRKKLKTVEYVTYEP